MTTFIIRKQIRIDEQTPPEEISFPIINCSLVGVYVSALQHPDGTITTITCNESITKSHRIQVENNICLNGACRNCERR